MSEQNYTIYKEFLDRLNIGVFILDADGRYIYVNPFYCRQINKSDSFFYQTSIPKLKTQGYLSNSAYERVCQSRKTVNALISIRNDLDTENYDTLTTSIPTFDEKGDIQYIYCTQEPVRMLTDRLQKALMNKGSIDYSASDTAYAVHHIIAESPQMKQILTTLKNIARTDVSVLISGPSGSGKEVLAKYTHLCSERKDNPLVVLNCSAIPESLIESELFGYVKGAFTGAAAEGKEGLIEAANGGTLFLDEINSMPKTLQVKLLRVLETKQVTPIGSTKSIDIDFRLICASNEDLKKLVDEGDFRLDLYYRINVFSVVIPPLCERKDDIAPLAIHYTEYFCNKYKCVHFLGNYVLQQLEEFPWEGNVRELKNFIERLIISVPNDELQIASIPENVILSDAKHSSDTEQTFMQNEEIQDNECLLDRVGLTFHEYMDLFEKKLLEKTLSDLGSPKAAAEALQLNITSIYRKLQKHKIKY